MAYNNVPLANQRISDTQPLIQSNFQQIQTAFSVNHVPIADGSGDQGKHNFITFPLQGATPAFGANEFGIWNEQDPITMTNQIWLNNPTIGQQIPWALSNFNSIGTTNIRNGYFYLPCGFLVKFGLVSPVATGNNNYNFPTVDSGAVAIPAFVSKVIFVAAWPVVVGGVQSISANVFSLTAFAISNQGTNNIQCSFVAIGV